MLFNTFEFIFFFLVTIIVYYVLNYKYRWIWLLIVSYFFYYSWEPKLTLLLLTSTFVDYFCGIKIYDSKKDSVRKVFLYISIGINLTLLIFFKYLGFFTETTLDIIKFFGVDVPNIEQNKLTHDFSRILLPIGISFYTFQTLSYSIEVYRKNLNPERHFGRYALYVSFFPQLVAGPIERAQNLIPQLKKNISLNINSIRIGLMLMAWGYFMKMVVADRLGVYVDIVFEHPEKYSGIPLIVGAYFFTFQIYFDFAAYSIIAIGAARTLGYDLMANFNKPIYFRDANDFWSRWHISLMTWLRDYLYRPLVRNVKLNKNWALLIVFLISGLWHGAGWNFIIWGILNGLLLLFDIATKKIRKNLTNRLSEYIPPYISKFIWWFIVWHTMIVFLIFFRTPTVPSAINYISHIPKIYNLRISVIDNFELMLSFLFIIIVQTVHYFKPDKKVFELIINKSFLVRWSLYILFIFVIVFFSVTNKNPFIYFQF